VGAGVEEGISVVVVVDAVGTGLGACVKLGAGLGGEVGTGVGCCVVVVVDTVGTGLGACVTLGAGLGSPVGAALGSEVGWGVVVGAGDDEGPGVGSSEAEGSGGVLVGARVFGGPGGSDGSGVGTVGQVLEGHAVGTGVAPGVGSAVEGRGVARVDVVDVVGSGRG